MIQQAATAVGRYSQLTWSEGGTDPDELELVTEIALRDVGLLVAWIVIKLALPFDRRAVEREASDFVDEVVAEDDCVAHGMDAIGALLEAHLRFRTQGLQVSHDELDRHAVRILAPLVAQAASLTRSCTGEQAT